MASTVPAGTYDRAILVCGTGLGVAMSANEVPGIRAALSNDARIVTMGARVVGPEPAKSIADAFRAQALDPRGRSGETVAAAAAPDVRCGVLGGRGGSAGVISSAG